MDMNIINYITCAQHGTINIKTASYFQLVAATQSMVS
jgi:hypothetical protein